MNMIRSFNVEFAVKYGFEEAIIYRFIDEFEGITGKAATKNDLSRNFPFWDEKSINKILKSLLNQGLINENPK